MVLQDPFDKTNKKNERSDADGAPKAINSRAGVLHDAVSMVDGRSKIPVAAPLDRLSAAIIDLSILGVFISLVSAPLAAHMEASKLIERWEDYSIYSVMVLLVAGGVAVFYQAASIWFFGCTLGQRLMGLRVVNIWNGNSPSFYKSLIRGVVWWLDLVMVIPLTGLFTDSYRRSTHDKLSDTIVVMTANAARTQVRSDSGSPTPTEVGFARAVVLMFFLAVGSVLILALSTDLVRLNQKSERTQPIRFLHEAVCEDVRGVQDIWPTENGKSASSLQIALALYAAGLADESCLESESRSEMAKSKPDPLALLARAFVTASDPTLSDAYIDEICRSYASSEACRLSEILDLLNNEEPKVASKMFDEGLPHSSQFFKIWAIKHFEHILDFESELALIGELWPQDALSRYLSVRRSVALWGIGRREEARATMASLVRGASDEEGVKLSGWFCARELDHSCPDHEPDSCRVLRSGVDHTPTILNDPEMSISYLKAEECRSGSTIQYSVLKNVIPNDQTRLLIDSIQFAKSKGSGLAKAKYLDLIQDDGASPLISAEALGRLIDLIEKPDELQALSDHWKDMDPMTWEWRSVGAHLVARFQKLKAFDQSIEIGETLLSVDPKNTDVRETIMVSAFKAKNYSFAWKMANPDTTSNFSTPRGPASNPSFRGALRVVRAPSKSDSSGIDVTPEEVRKALEKRFGGR